MVDVSVEQMEALTEGPARGRHDEVLLFLTSDQPGFVSSHNHVFDGATTVVNPRPCSCPR